ncbi:hypothetical protein SPB21_31845 [Leptothoe sp. ISB3NOV94-8A]
MYYRYSPDNICCSTTSIYRPPQFLVGSSYSKEDAYSSGDDYFLDERHLVQKRSRQA